MVSGLNTVRYVRMRASDEIFCKDRGEIVSPSGALGASLVSLRSECSSVPFHLSDCLLYYLTPELAVALN